MKKFYTFVIALMFFTTIFVSDSSAYKLGSVELVKKGVGIRSMFLLGTVYYASLYVPKDFKEKSAKEIIMADKPMSVILTIDTRFLTKDRFLKAIKEGFGKAAGSGYTTSAAKKQKLYDMFTPSMKIQKGDVLFISYLPGKGLSFRLKSKEAGKTTNMGIAQGFDLKKALFAIWLGPNPVQASLKKGMLGN